ncbi:MAG: OmpA family protein [Tepidisphaeraceae bacterium]
MLVATLARRAVTFALLSVGLLSLGCQNAMYDQNLALKKQNEELQGLNDTSQKRIEELTAELGNRPDAAQVGQLQSALAERDAKIADLQKQLTTPTPGAPAGAEPGIEGIETSFNARNGELTVRVPGDVLFDSGVATLKKGSLGTLDKIAAAIKKDYPGKTIRVEGHTDNDPLVKTRQQWTDNRGLSVARAGGDTIP